MPGDDISIHRRWEGIELEPGTPGRKNVAQHERLRSYALDLEERNSELQRRLTEAHDTKPQIAIQVGHGVIYPFPAHSSFGVLELDDPSIEPGSRSWLAGNIEGHTHCVAFQRPDTHSSRVCSLLSGTEMECQMWLAQIAHAIERAGIPTVLTQPLPAQEAAQAARDDAVRWGS